MAENTNHFPPPPPDSPYFSLTFQMYDKIRLIDCDQQCLNMIQQVVTTNWPRYNTGAFEIIFGGLPFKRSNNKAEVLVLKRLCCALLTSLQLAGWELCICSNLSQTTNLTTWFFQKNPANIRRGRNCRRRTAERGIVCLSLSSTNKLQLVNAPKYLHEELLQCAGPLLQSYKVHGPDFEVKLVGNPWFPSLTTRFVEGVAARQLLLDTIRKFDSLKFRFYGTANLKGTADCIFFEPDQNYIGGETRYCMLSLNCSDRIRLIDCPQAVVDAVGRCITQYWPDGVQDTRLYDCCVEYKLIADPWLSYGDDAISSCFLFTHILQSLSAVGWTVMGALDISRIPNDIPVFVLRSRTPASIAHICICPSDLDLIQLINAPIDVQNAVACFIHSNWPHGVQKERTRLMAYEWKLKGRPWWSHFGNDYATSQRFMTRLLNEMARLGWRVICSADVSTKYVHQQRDIKYPYDVHNWFLASTSPVAQPPDALRPSSSVGLVTPSAPSSEVFPPPPSYSEIAIGFALPSAPSSEASTLPPSYSEVMNE